MVSVTDEARRWLAGRSVTMFAAHRNGCCGGHAEVVVAQVGEPDDPGDFGRTDVGGVTVHLDPQLALAGDEGWTIALDGFGRWRRLTVLRGHHMR